MASDGNGNGHSRGGSLTVPSLSSGPEEPESLLGSNEARQLHFAELNPRFQPYFEKRVVEVPFPLAEFYHNLGAANGHLISAPGELEFSLPLNSPCYIRLDDKEVTAIYRGDRKFSHVPRVKPDSGRIAPRNDEQAFACHLLADPAIKCLILLGPAGVGKSLMVLAHIVAGHNRYDNIYLVKQACSIGEKEGYLPGEVPEKFAPYAQSFYDNLGLLTANNSDLFGMMVNPEGDQSRLATKITMCSLGKFSGRKLHRSLVVLEECQNMSDEEAHIMATRAAGEEARVVVMGDVDQISYAKSRNLAHNGLVYLLEDTRGERGCAQVGLLKNEQSEFVAMLTRKWSARRRQA